MTQSPLEPPNRSTSFNETNETNLSPNRPDTELRPDERTTGPSRPLSFDEVVALFVAFLSLGSILLWGLTRGGLGVLGGSLADNTLITPPESGETQPFAFGFGSNDPEAKTSNGSIEGAIDGADNTKADATNRQGGNDLENQRDRAYPGNMWASVKTGMAGAAAGITGVAASADKAPAQGLPEPKALPPTAADSAAVPLSAAATARPKDAIQFDDVPDNYWAKPYIDALSSRELISGFEDGTFKPDQPVTRAQIADIVSRTFDLTTDKENLAFSDIESDYWAKESIGEVVKGGFMSGFPNKTFAPNDPVTRAQALTTLVTGLAIAPPTNIQAALDRYTDATNIPKWANEKVAAATAGGLVVNYPNLQQLNPSEPTTRAELSAFIYQALAKEGVVEAVESAYVVKP